MPASRLAGSPLRGLDEDLDTRKLIAAAVAAEQVLDLVDRGVTEFHFYTMNRADLVYAICHPPGPCGLDGAMGTEIQALKLSRRRFRGERFAATTRTISRATTTS